MKEYIGTKRILATPMNRREYNRYRDWEMPANENGDDEGFLVEYLDSVGQDPRHSGYISWSPAEQFHGAYQPVSRMTFGHAVEMIKTGHAVARAGWNGKGMFLYLVPGGLYPPQTPIAHKAFNGGAVPYSHYIAMKTADGMVVPWLASQTDVLAEDWSVVSITPQA